MVIWLIGLSGAGKTTIGRELTELWRHEESNTVLLDGDQVRAVLADDAVDDPYSVEGRRRNAERMTALCELLDQQGINVVCCILSIFPEMREQNRNRFSHYLEVHVSTSLEICTARDRKNLYAPALMGRRRNVVGVDIPFAAPRDADLVVDNGTPGVRPRDLAREILRAARSRKLVARQ